MVVVCKGSRARKLEHGGQVSCGVSSVRPEQARTYPQPWEASTAGRAPCVLTHTRRPHRSKPHQSLRSVSTRSRVLTAAPPINSFTHSRLPTLSERIETAEHCVWLSESIPLFPYLSHCWLRAFSRLAGGPVSPQTTGFGERDTSKSKRWRKAELHVTSSFTPFLYLSHSVSARGDRTVTSCI